MMTSTTSEVWKKQPRSRNQQPLQMTSQRDLEQDYVHEEDDDDVPPEVPKRTSSKGPGSVAIQSASVTSTSASGRSSRESVSFRGQVRAVGNGAANNEAAAHTQHGPHSASTVTPASTMNKQQRVCLATGRPLVEWSSESTLEASELVRRHRLHHHHHLHHHHLASYPRHGRPIHGMPARAKPATKAAVTRQVASADEASDSDEIDVCETCSEWLSKALLCSCQVPSSASSSPSQGQEQLSKQQHGQHQLHPEHHQRQQHGHHVQHHPQHQLQQRYQQRQMGQPQSRLLRP